MGFFDYFKRGKHKLGHNTTLKQKKLKLLPEEIKLLVTGHGACMATDKITVDGEPVDYTYREKPINNVDSGWRFFSGTETQEYVDDSNNSTFYQINTIANYDSAIIPYLDFRSA